METSKKPGILSELNYFPPLSWFHLAKESEVWTFDIYQHYQKSTWRNRCYVLGPNGVLRLSIPLERGKNERRAFKEVKISYDSRWQKEHWRSLCACYRRSVYFEYFEDDLAPLFETSPVYLLDWNLQLMHFVLKIINLKPSITFTEAYIPPESMLYTDIRARTIQDAIHSEMVKNLSPYSQVFGDRFPFQSNLSIIDLIFNRGKIIL